MARAKSPQKRQTILAAAVEEIARAGLGASTANIAKTADVAEGTLFTYFASKNELINELYLYLKEEVYSRLNTKFPHGAELQDRVRHVWTETLYLAIEKPAERRVSLQLHLSTVLTDVTRNRISLQSEDVVKTMKELAGRGMFKQLPEGFAATAMGAMQDAVVETLTRTPRYRAKLIERGFEAFWRMAE